MCGLILNNEKSLIPKKSFCNSLFKIKKNENNKIYHKSMIFVCITSIIKKYKFYSILKYGKLFNK